VTNLSHRRMLLQSRTLAAIFARALTSGEYTPFDARLHRARCGVLCDVHAGLTHSALLELPAQRSCRALYQPILARFYNLRSALPRLEI
jgi:hypothetical protein